MKERPILFSAPMVRAILDGSKTQTRRVLKDFDIKRLSSRHEFATTGPHQLSLKETPGYIYVELGGGNVVGLPCPYGQPGDRLWARENGWQRPERSPRMMREGADTWKPYYYDADGLMEADHEQFKEWGFKRRPSIHMPRWASRINLEITGVRVERLQDISDADAAAEGVKRSHAGGAWGEESLIEDFGDLWESINGTGSWDANPWVWVINFERAA